MLCAGIPSYQREPAYVRSPFIWFYCVVLCDAFDIYVERDGWVNARELNVNFCSGKALVLRDMVRMKINGRSCSTAGNDRS